VVTPSVSVIMEGPARNKRPGHQGHLDHSADSPPSAAGRRAGCPRWRPASSWSNSVEQRYARLLFFSLWPSGGGFESYEDHFRALRSEQAARDQLSVVVESAFDHAQHITAPMSRRLASSPLRTHACYSREEIVAALDYAHLRRLPNSFREGVLWADEWKSDAFLITLTKSETDYSPTTMYQDYAISPSLFHWETQSQTTVTSPTGQRYMNHAREGSNILLFAVSTGSTSSAPRLTSALGPGNTSATPAIA